MILEMYMKNCALIEESRLTINSGLNILTGETGAGKSIIIEALGLCLGEKYDRSFLRKGTDKGVCEILVSSKSSNLKEVLDKYDIDYDDDEIIITRVIYSDGKSVARINGRTIKMSILKEIALTFIDLHGQHQNQALFNKDTHLKFLDLFGGKKLDLPKEEYKNTAVDTDTEAAVKKEFVVDEEAVQAGKEFLQKIFHSMKIEVVMEKFVNKADSTVTLKLHGPDMGILIGKHGQTLDALQYLTNLVANKNSSERIRIIIDVEDYRERRIETLSRLAVRLADKVKRNGERVVLEPMNPHERKIIHMALQNDRRITTLSEGEEPYRKVVIELKK